MFRNFSQGNAKEGIKLLKQGLKSNTASSPVRFELQYHLANAYRSQKKWELARKHYQKALSEELLLPLKVAALINYGGLLQEVGEINEAAQIYQTVIQIDPSQAIAYFNLGLLLKQRNQLMEAIKAYQQAITLQPDYAEAYQNLGVTAYKAGLMEESLNAFQIAIKLYEQQNPSIAKNLKQNLVEIGLMAPDSDNPT